jgi:hypothetical protein
MSWEKFMQTAKKFMTGAPRRQAAPVDVDRSSIDLPAPRIESLARRFVPKYAVVLPD